MYYSIHPRSLYKDALAFSSEKLVTISTHSHEPLRTIFTYLFINYFSNSVCTCLSVFLLLGALILALWANGFRRSIMNYNDGEGRHLQSDREPKRYNQVC